jgi:type I restriction enzyme R subunit
MSLGIDLNKIMEELDTLERLEALRTAYDTIIAYDENKERFKVILNILTSLYEASKPEIFEKNWYNEKYSLLVYMHGLFYKTIDDKKVERARNRMQQILDGSVSANGEFLSVLNQNMFNNSKVIDLSKIDVEQLRKEIRTAEYKAIEIDDLKEYIEKALQQMINKNCTRMKFSERYKSIIDTYNAGGSENEEYYEQLVKLVQELQREDNRATTEGLLEEELEIYDLLVKGKKLSKADEQKVKLSAENLFKKLMEKKQELLVVDWYKDDQPKERVRAVIEVSLNEDLPDSYDKESFNSKINLLMNHFVDMAVQGYGWIAA